MIIALLTSQWKLSRFLDRTIRDYLREGLEYLFNKANSKFQSSFAGTTPSSIDKVSNLAKLIIHRAPTREFISAINFDKSDNH